MSCASGLFVLCSSRSDRSRTSPMDLVDIQRRLGHRKPDTTLRVYAHEWKYRDAQRSQIGDQLGHLFNQPTSPTLAPTPSPLALPPAP
jgi:hypothetical protein